MSVFAKCAGCRNDFYNDKNPLGVRRCWSLDRAKVVKRWRIGTWTDPTQPGAFARVTTYDCHEADGYRDHEKLPECARYVRRRHHD